MSVVYHEVVIIIGIIRNFVSEDSVFFRDIVSLSIFMDNNSK